MEYSNEKQNEIKEGLGAISSSFHLIFVELSQQVFLRLQQQLP